MGRKRKNCTSLIREKVNELVARHFRGEMSKEELYEELLVELQPLLQALQRECVEKFGGHLTEDDISITLLEGLWVAVTRLSPDYPNPFSFLRKSLKGNLLDLGKTLAYASKASDGCALPRAEVDGHDGMDEDEDEDGYEPADPRVDVEGEVVVKDFVEKLPPLERKVVQMLLDGYSLSEVSRACRLSLRELRQLLDSVKKNWQRG